MSPEMNSQFAETSDRWLFHQDGRIRCVTHHYGKADKIISAINPLAAG